MTVSVLCVPGLFETAASMKNLLAGTAVAGNTQVNCPYNNWAPLDGNVDNGVTAFDALANSTGGVKIAFGDGLGACVLTRWLAQKGPTSGIPPADLTFVLIRNPDRTYGGLLHSTTYDGTFVDPAGNSWLLTPDTVPAGTPYTVADLAVQYDGWCDWPDITTSHWYWLAELNALAGITDANYKTPTLGDVNNTELIEGNITWLLAPTVPVPLLGTLDNPATEAIDKKLRPLIESCYSREYTPIGYTPPSTIPYPAVATVACADPAHFYVHNGGLTPQPWMQLQRVTGATFPAQTVKFPITNTGTNYDKLLQTAGATWINLSPVAQWVYGLVTCGPNRVTLQARSKGYIAVWTAIDYGYNTSPTLVEASRFGIGADDGFAGVISTGIAYCEAEVRANTRTFTVAPEETGWMRVEPGQAVTAMVHTRFTSTNWETSDIDGGDTECVSSIDCGELTLDMFATPVIEPAPPTLGVLGAPAITVIEVYGGKVSGYKHAPYTPTPTTDWLNTALDPSVFIWTAVDFPTTVFPLSAAIAAGVADTVAVINAVSGPFILVGHGVGASVISGVYDQIRSGSLTARRADLLAGVTFGNPRRQKDHLWPGVANPDPGAAGIDPSPLSGTEGLWWDFVNARDPLADVQASTQAGGWAANVWAILTNRIADGTWASVTAWLGSVSEAETDLAQQIWNCIYGAPLAGANPNLTYNTTKPLAPHDKRTSLNIALDYITGFAGSNWGP